MIGDVVEELEENVVVVVAVDRIVFDCQQLMGKVLLDRELFDQTVVDMVSCTVAAVDNDTVLAAVHMGMVPPHKCSVLSSSGVGLPWCTPHNSVVVDCFEHLSLMMRMALEEAWKEREVELYVKKSMSFLLKPLL